MRRTLAGITIFSALALSGCVDLNAVPPTSESSNTAPEVPTLPTARDSFMQGLWSEQVEGRNKPLVTPNHVVALVGDNISAWGPNNGKNWTHPIPVFDDSTETRRTIRWAPPSVVGVIVHGVAEAEGDPYPDYTENFIAFDIETGNVIASSTVQGKPFSSDQ